mgnify:CR=1 FL=1
MIRSSDMLVTFNKLMLFVVIFLFVVTISMGVYITSKPEKVGVSLSPNENCVDGDGVNYDLRGTTKMFIDGSENSYYDYCSSDNTKVVEYYCSANKIEKVSYACLNGCYNGACIS